MQERIHHTNNENQETFRECLSGVLVQRLPQPSKTPKPKRSTKARKSAIKPVIEQQPPAAADATQDAEELSEFIEVRQPLHALPSRT